MASLNKAILMGNMVADPELKQTPAGVSVCSFRIGVQRRFKDANGQYASDFINIVAWRNTAEFVSKYFAKGRMAVVSGRLQIRNWNDKDGNKRRSAEVVADNVYFGDSKRDGAAGGFDQTYGQPAYSQPAFNQQPAYGSFDQGMPGPAPASDFAMLEDDHDQLPF